MLTDREDAHQANVTAVTLYYLCSINKLSQLQSRTLAEVYSWQARSTNTSVIVFPEPLRTDKKLVDRTSRVEDSLTCACRHLKCF